MRCEDELTELALPSYSSEELEDSIAFLKSPLAAPAAAKRVEFERQFAVFESANVRRPCSEFKRRGKHRRRSERNCSSCGVVAKPCATFMWRALSLDHLLGRRSRGASAVLSHFLHGSHGPD